MSLLIVSFGTLDCFHPMLFLHVCVCVCVVVSVAREVMQRFLTHYDLTYHGITHHDLAHHDLTHHDLTSPTTSHVHPPTPLTISNPRLLSPKA